MSSNDIREFNLGSSTDIVIMVSESENEDSSLPSDKRALFRMKKVSLSRNSDFFKALLPVADQDPRWFDIQRQNDLFKALLSKKWKEAVKEYPEIEDHVITLYGDNIQSMRIWFSVFYREEVNPADVSIKEIWHTIRASDKYAIDGEKLPAVWEELDTQRELLFPCHFYDHAEAFQILTKSLVYKSEEQVFEKNPIGDHRLHLRPLVIQQMDAARGRLRNRLQFALFDKRIDQIRRSSCQCKKATVFDFLDELSRVDVNPLKDMIYKSSISELLRRLKDFKVENIGPPDEDCFNCGIDFQDHVETAARTVEKYFDGMCLDCMKEDPDLSSPYWQPKGYRGSYDRTCRIRHGEPSWYYSFMGRRERSRFQER
ncbi:uncharacterized protein N7483_012567 [Penicillium malachiteum]|uniref:uncharacterized protein n=1 Tax=Penicillium malachiteum TaxID=1324776 RepID=UPI0025466330|nr:uncharacterized protein N7483_012567 [Penicillium malachiteum]KAJ5715386.1 hypothetical protein N7483_012567 [Penicillium malachiteum]